MYERRDPIETSSPPPFDDALPFVTQPTQLLETRSPFFATPSDPFTTQPTQILPPQGAPHTTQPTQLLTPRSNRTYNLDSSQVQVPRSSPPADRHASPMSQSKPRLSSAMAPPGTFSAFPKAVPKPGVMDLTLASDDPPVDQDSEEEEYRGSNIPMSKLEQARVQETPQKAKAASFGFDVSRFAHTEQPRKRPADSSSFPPPPPKKSRQTGPARAMPIDLTEDSEDDMILADVPNESLRKKVERLGTVFPNKSVRARMDALMQNRCDYNATLDRLAAEEDDELLKSPQKGTAKVKTAEPVIAKSTAKRVLSKPVQSMQERYAKPTQASQAVESPEKPRKKGKLVRGRRNRSPETVTLSSSSPPPPKPKPQQRRVEPEEDDDEGIIISEDDDSEVQQVEEDDFDESNLLDFFNTCTVEAMVDLSGHKEEDIKVVFESRPFKSFAAIEKIHVDLRPDAGKKPRKPKVTSGDRLLTAAKSMWGAYETIDKVVKQCEERGRPMVKGMERWGIDIFGAATDGEIAVTSLDDSDTASNRDSGYQSPRSTNASDEEREDLRKVVERTAGKRKLLKKPAVMNDDVVLKDYQVVGLNWLNLLWSNGISGILADDMGLGKTCQVISFLSHLKESNSPVPHVIVVPGSTLENWAREFEHFCTAINFKIYYGGQDERYQMQDEILDSIQAGEVDVILTTYDLAWKKQDGSFLRKCRPQAIIFDEGHCLRNSNTLRYKSLMKINAKFRLLLTGTPLQNSLQELASILAFLMPDIFDNEEVKDSVAVVFKHKAKVNESDTHGTLLSTQRINRARSMMTPFVLRRKKAQVLKDLPPKTCRVEYCELLPTQKKFYNQQLEKQRQVLLDREAGLTPKEQTNVMMRLRQAAIHPLLFREHYTDATLRKLSKALYKEPDLNKNNSPEAIFEDLEVSTDYQCHSWCLKYPATCAKFALKPAAMFDSGKVQALVKLLKHYKQNGDRALVFSQFTSVMDILEWVLDDLDIQYCRLDGRTPIADRQQLLDEFHHDESITVFMLSTKSGGAGINLACANKVVIFDSSFNPQDDVQAENRAHRVGQVRDVEVVRLVTKGTVEEQIHALGESKLALDKLVSGEEETGAKKKEELNAAEQQGLMAVQEMLRMQLGKEGEGETEEKGDVKEEYLEGLKRAGLDMSAA